MNNHDEKHIDDWRRGYVVATADWPDYLDAYRRVEWPKTPQTRCAPPETLGLRGIDSAAEPRHVGIDKGFGIDSGLDPVAEVLDLHCVALVD
jgi:hypothetical protein